MNSPIRKNQNGFAMLVALMVLSLGSSFAFLAFQVSTTELEIARYSEGEASVQYLAESGVQQVLSWATTPSASPDPAFFRDLLTTDCTGQQDHPDFPSMAPPLPDLPQFMASLTDMSGPFSELMGFGKIVDLRLYAPTHPDGICTVEVEAETNTGTRTRIRVNITANPLAKITAGIQGGGNPVTPSPVWAHWGEIRYLGKVHLGKNIEKVPILNGTAFPNGDPYLDDPASYNLNIDPLVALNVQYSIATPVADDGDSYLSRPNVNQNVSTLALDKIDLGRLKSYIKNHGEYYTVSSDGQFLLKNGKHRIVDGVIADQTFDEIFEIHEGDVPHYHLVWIDNHGYPFLEIYGGSFQGYFYFSGDVDIHGNKPGRVAHALSPPETGSIPVILTDINLNGLFYVQGQMKVEGRFTSYGALYSQAGFEGPGATDIEVWYNSDFGASMYEGVPSVTTLAGTWVTVESVGP